MCHRVESQQRLCSLLLWLPLPRPQNCIDQGLEQLRTALSLDPLSSVISTNYGVILMDARRYPEALAQFQKVLRRDPNSVSAYVRLSQLYAMTGRFAESVSEARSSRNQSPSALTRKVISI